MNAQLKTFKDTVNTRQILIGAAGLIVGALVYLVDRSPDHAYFVYRSDIDISLYNVLPNLFGPIGHSLPAFSHVFSFILITAGLIGCRKRGYLIICLSWFIVDCTFELGQKFKSSAVRIIPDWFAGIPYLENTSNYFFHGTFDYFDLVAIIIGAVLAYITLSHTIRGVRKS